MSNSTMIHSTVASSTESSGHRRGGNSRLIAAQAVGIIVACLLVAVVLFADGVRYVAGLHYRDHPRQCQAGAIVESASLGLLPIPHAALAPSREIGQRPPTGMKYSAVLKGAIVGCALDMDYGPCVTNRPVTLVYVFEMVSTHAMEVGPGACVTEVVRFDRIRAVKLLTPAEDVRVDLGRPGESVLPETSETSATADGIFPVAVEATGTRLLGSRDANRVRQAGRSVALARVDPLSGKSVRFTYTHRSAADAIEPIQEAITAPDARYLLCRPLLSFRDISFSTSGAAPRRSTVDAWRLTPFMDPSTRLVLRGQATAQSSGEQAQGGNRKFRVRVESCRSEMTCGGYADFFVLEVEIGDDPVDGFVEKAQFTGIARFGVEDDSHLLARVNFLEPCKVTMSYGAKRCGTSSREPR